MIKVPLTIIDENTCFAGHGAADGRRWRVLPLCGRDSASANRSRLCSAADIPSILHTTVLQNPTLLQQKLL